MRAFEPGPGFALLAFLALCVGPAGAQGVPTTILTNATVIDCSGAPPKADATVIIRGGRIAEVRAGRYEGQGGDGIRVFDLAGILFEVPFPVGEIIVFLQGETVLVIPRIAWNHRYAFRVRRISLVEESLHL